MTGIGGGWPDADAHWPAEGDGSDGTSGGPPAPLNGPSGTWPGPAREPTPWPPPPVRQSPRRSGVAVLVGVLVGLVLFGPAGYAVRAWTAPERPRPAPSAVLESTPAVTPSATIAPYEQAMRDYNRDRVGDGPLAAFAAPWLPRVAGCARSGQPHGPDLGAGERTRVQCSYGAATLYLIEYKSTDARDRAKATIQGQAIDARTLTPGVAAPTRRATPGGSSDGNVIEYAYRQKQKGQSARLVGGVWWDATNAPVAGYLVAYWDQVGSSWAPLRDLWQRAN